MYAHLGIRIPLLASNYISPNVMFIFTVKMGSWAWVHSH